MFGTALAEFVDEFSNFCVFQLRRGPKQWLPTDLALARVDEWGTRFGSAYNHSGTMRELRDLISGLARDTSEISTIATQFVNLPFRSQRHLMYADAGLLFTAAHELAHHLLNHTRFGVKDLRAPGRTILADWLTELDYELPNSITRRQLEEFEADALALRLLLGDATDPAARYRRSLTAVAGAFSALPALSVVQGTMEQLDPSTLLHDASDAHPSFDSRAKVLLDLVQLSATDHPDGAYLDERIGRDVPRHPGGLALQLWACRSALTSVVSVGLWTPRLRLPVDADLPASSAGRRSRDELHLRS